MTIKVTATRSFYSVEINGQVIEVAKWDGTVHRSQIEAIELAQRILVARKAGK